MPDHNKNKFTELIQQHSGIIHKVIGLYVDPEEDKKDLYQEILLQGWKSFGNFQGNSSFSTWLYKVSLNTVLAFNRKQMNSESLENAPEMASATEKRENYEVLYHIIRSLDEIDKMLITLHLDGYKNIEIAEITGMKQNHINVKIHRIKNKIIKKFKEVSHE